MYASVTEARKSLPDIPRGADISRFFKPRVTGADRLLYDEAVWDDILRLLLKVETRTSRTMLPRATYTGVCSYCFVNCQFRLIPLRMATLLQFPQGTCSFVFRRAAKDIPFGKTGKSDPESLRTRGRVSSAGRLLYEAERVAVVTEERSAVADDDQAHDVEADRAVAALGMVG